MPLDLPLRTERLELREHRDADLDWLLGVYSDDATARYLLDDPWTREVAEKKLLERCARTDLDSDADALALVIEHRGEPVGDVALWFTDRGRRVAEIGWVLDHRHAGHGFAREAVAAVLDCAFDHYRLHRVVAQMDARNTASANLARAVGMRQEAHHLQDYWSKGEWTDSLIFALLATDPR